MIGLDGQIGYGIETTPGTPVTVTRFLPFVPPLGLREVPNYAPSRAIGASRRTSRPSALGPSNINGPVTHEFYAEGTGLLLQAILDGTPATTGSDPYTHTYDFGAEIKSVSAQVGLPSLAATHPVSYAGLRARQWTLTVRPGDVYAYLTIDWIGGALADTDGTPSLASASFPATLTPLLFSHGATTLAGSAIDIDSITITGTTGWTSEPKISATSPRAPRVFRGGRDLIGGSFVYDMANMTHLGRHLAGTQAALVFALTAAAGKSCTFTMNCEFPGDMPTIQNEGKTKETVRFNCVHASSDASALTVALVNSDSAP